MCATPGIVVLVGIGTAGDMTGWARLTLTIISGLDTDRKEAVTVSHRLAHFAFLVLHFDDVLIDG